jgi:hypothetical protein
MHRRILRRTMSGTLPEKKRPETSENNEVYKPQPIGRVLASIGSVLSETGCQAVTEASDFDYANNYPTSRKKPT